MRLCFATNNANKLSEIQHLLRDKIALVSLSDIGCTEELAETQTTLEGNSRQKAAYVYEHYHLPVFADDTGLEVHALGGAPGVFSARYAGAQRDMEANIRLLHHKLADKDDWSAQFRTVITLIMNDQTHQFEGIVKGQLIAQKRGIGGFGYDPIFIPDGFDTTFAEMPVQEKNKISHRARAVRKLVDFLNNESLR